MEKIKQWTYYFLIGIVSFVALVFLPMIGTEVGLDWNIPNTTVGWIVWVTVRLIISAINVLIFHSFMCQAKINVKDNENFKKAQEILMTQKEKTVIPRSPKEFNKREYGKKATTVFLTSALATVALTQAILTFDWMSMLTYLFTILMGLIFGILQMKKAEDYWTDEYYRYALMVQEQNRLAEITEDAQLAKNDKENVEDAENR